MRAQEESPLQPIFTHLPALCLSRNDIPLPIITDQPFKQIDQYRLPRKTGAHQRRIQRLRLGTVALYQGLPIGKQRLLLNGGGMGQGPCQHGKQ